MRRVFYSMWVSILFFAFVLLWSDNSKLFAQGEVKKEEKKEMVSGKFERKSLSIIPVQGQRGRATTSTSQHSAGLGRGEASHTNDRIDRDQGSEALADRVQVSVWLQLKVRLTSNRSACEWLT